MRWAERAYKRGRAIAGLTRRHVRGLACVFLRPRGIVQHLSLRGGQRVFDARRYPSSNPSSPCLPCCCPVVLERSLERWSACPCAASHCAHTCTHTQNGLDQCRESTAGTEPASEQDGGWLGHCVLFSALVPGALSWIIRPVWSQVVQIAVPSPSSPVLGLPPSQTLCRRKRTISPHLSAPTRIRQRTAGSVGALRGEDVEDESRRRRRRRSAGGSGDTRAVARCCPPWLEQESERASTRLPPVYPVSPHLSSPESESRPSFCRPCSTSCRPNQRPAERRSSV